MEKKEEKKIMKCKILDKHVSICILQSQQRLSPNKIKIQKKKVQSLKFIIFSRYIFLLQSSRQTCVSYVPLCSPNYTLLFLFLSTSNNNFADLVPKRWPADLQNRFSKVTFRIIVDCGYIWEEKWKRGKKNGGKGRKS